MSEALNRDVIFMVDKKDDKKTGKITFSDEKKLGELATKLHGQLADEMKGRPYLMVVTTHYGRHKPQL